MVKTSTPELKAYMDKKVYLQLNGNRKVTGVLRGFDPFLNVVLDDANELDKKTDQVVRGNSIIMLEALERMTTTDDQ